MIGVFDFDSDLSDLNKSFNGIAIDEPSITVASDGTTITLTLERSGGGDMRFKDSDGITQYDSTPAATIALTAGTDAVPQMNYVYLLKSTNAITLSTTAWPTAEHSPLAKVLCQTAASIQTDQPYMVRNLCASSSGTTGIGHLSHINSWIRKQHAQWVSGAACTPTAGASVLDIAISAGVVGQLHDHVYPAFDTSTGSEIYVVNDPDTAYTKVADLTQAAGVDKDSAGVTLGDASTDFYNLVLWGVSSDLAGDCKLMCNLPNAAYADDAASAAQLDTSNTAIYDIPDAFKGTGFLIARLTIQEAADTYSIILNTDLRGKIPANTP